MQQLVVILNQYIKQCPVLHPFTSKLNILLQGLFILHIWVLKMVILVTATSVVTKLDEQFW